MSRLPREFLESPITNTAITLCMIATGVFMVQGKIVEALLYLILAGQMNLSLRVGGLTDDR